MLEGSSKLAMILARPWLCVERFNYKNTEIAKIARSVGCVRVQWNCN